VFLFDTNVLSEITSRQPRATVLSRLMGCDRELRFASDITRYELRYGSALLPPGNRMWQRIEDTVLPRFNWLPADAEVCMQAADIGATLRQAGKPIDMADLLIAATAQAHQLIMVTRNVKHFDRIEGLRVENWFPSD
jgi:tRNA(fMet)-specific endonuclease VapC